MNVCPEIFELQNTLIETNRTETPASRNGLLTIFAGALICAVLFTLLSWSQDWPFDKARFLRGTDDLLRMVIVRDLIAGQGWFDLHQYRLGLPGGTLMHWSRLVDLPLALLVRFGAMFDLGHSEIIAATLWPLSLFVICIMGFMVGVQRIANTANMLPGLVIGGFGLVASGLFDTGSIDHHNIQLALAMWLVALLMPSKSAPRDFAIAGVLASLMLAIGMEALPIIVGAGLVVVSRLQLEGEALVMPTRRFGLGLALSLVVLFFALVGPQNYRNTACDSYSLFHLCCGGIGGLALYLGLNDAVRWRLPSANLTAPLIAGALALLVAVVFFHTCLTDPYGSLDPKLKLFWLDSVFEAQSASRIFALDPWLLPSLFGMPLLALGWLSLNIWRGTKKSISLGLFVLLLIATAVTVFQMRGTEFSGPISALVLASLVTILSEGVGKQRPILLISIWLLSCAITWKLLSTAGIALFAHGHSGPLIAGADVKQAGALCHTSESLTALVSEPTGTVAAANGLGPDILFSTPHRVLAGPYHRDVAGNLAWINAMIGTPDEAQAILRDAGTTLLAICPDDPDERDFLRAAPAGFVGQLLKGQTFSWIEPVQQTMGLPLRVWRIKKQ
jgi:hypothetical protein